MNKFVSVLVLGSVLVLSACGGDSDSSGSSSYNSSQPSDFNGLSNCATQGNDIFVREVNKFTSTRLNRSCLVSKPDLIDGRTFSLGCEIDSNGNQLFDIKSSSSRDSQAIKNDIESNNKNDIESSSKYKYKCLPQVKLPQAGPVTPIRPSQY